jgi:hypothetical protein
MRPRLCLMGCSRRECRNRPTAGFRGSPVCHVRLDDHVMLIAEGDLAGPVRDLVTAVLAVGDPE